VSGSPARCASVAVPLPVRRQFAYEVDEELAAHIEVGLRVRVPFGNRKISGTVVQWPCERPEGEVQLKRIEAVLHGRGALTPELLDLTRFAADYYLCSWGEAIEAALPPDPGPPVMQKLVRRLPGAVPEALPARARAQRLLLASLPANGEPVQYSRLGRGEKRAVRLLQEAGMVNVTEQPAESDMAGSVGSLPPAEPGPDPTAAQKRVLEQLQPAIEEQSYHPFLLYGATGSGKTEVYLRAAERVLSTGRAVLYLVPEIGLTPLLLSQIERRFPGQVAVLHSALPKRKRFEAWELVRRGLRRFVIGTRSAIFAPLSDPGLIVIDEEQDGSYKQEEKPRYNGRDLAVVRARESGATIILGSATPSMESFQHARAGRYSLLHLGGRVRERPLAEVEIVDMRLHYLGKKEVTPLSDRLLEELKSCLQRGEQALVLRNRRGWAAALHCPLCGERVGCPQCAVSMTWHKGPRRLRCHYCALERPYPDSCSCCGASELKMLGEGTEKIEDLLRRELPEATIERMDRDTIRRRGAHERLLRRFEQGEIDILVGTQMIAKGHDFPRVTLVGVLSADQSLGLPDFRAGERTFQLLTQVAGRAGRGQRPGKVIVQAFDPDAAVLKLAADQDYEAFFDREIGYRRALRYPPLTAMVQIIVTDRDAGHVREWAAMVARALRHEERGRLIVAGPGPAPIEKLKGLHRQQILARSAGRRRLVESVDRAVAAVAGKVPARALHIDVDPRSLL
jgi:primosomal protein N' (replication factor Y)